MAIDNKTIFDEFNKTLTDESNDTTTQPQALYDEALKNASINYSDKETGRQDFLDKINGFDDVMKNFNTIKNDGVETTTVNQPIDSVDGVLSNLNEIKNTISTNPETIVDQATNQNQYDGYLGQGITVNSKGEITGKEDINSDEYKKMRGFTSNSYFFDNIMMTASNFDEKRFSKKIESNATDLKTYGLTDDDISEIDKNIIAGNENFSLNVAKPNTEKYNTVQSNIKGIQKAIANRTDYLAEKSAISDFQGILKARNIASEESARTNEAEKSTRTTATIFDAVLKMSIYQGVASTLAFVPNGYQASGTTKNILDATGKASSSATSFIAKKGTSLLSKAGLNNPTGRLITRTVGAGILETTAEIPSIQSQAERTDMEFKDVLESNLLLNITGNAIGEGVGYIGKKSIDFMQGIKEAKEFKKVANLINMDTNELSKSIIANPVKMSDDVVKAIKLNNFSFGNETLDSVFQDSDKLKVLFSSISNVEQSQLLSDILTGTKLSNNKLELLGKMLEQSDIDEDTIKKSLSYINSEISTDGTRIVNATIPENNLNIANTTIDDAKKAIDRNFADKLINAPDIITDTDFQTFIEAQAKYYNVDINDKTAMDEFINNFSLTKNIKNVDELKQLYKDDPIKYNNIIMDFLSNSKIGTTDMKFVNPEITSEIKDIDNGIKIRKQFRDDADVAKLATSLNLNSDQLDYIRKSTSMYIPSNYNVKINDSTDRVISMLNSQTPRKTLETLYNTHIKPNTAIASGKAEGLSFVEFLNSVNKMDYRELSTFANSMNGISIDAQMDFINAIRLINDVGAEPDSTKILSKYLIADRGATGTKLAMFKSMNLLDQNSIYYSDVVKSQLSELMEPKLANSEAGKKLLDSVGKKTDNLIKAINNDADEKLINTMLSDISTDIMNSQSFYKLSKVNGVDKKVLNKDFINYAINRNTILALLTRTSTQFKNVASNAVGYSIDTLSNRFAKAVDNICFGKGTRGFFSDGEDVLKNKLKETENYVATVAFHAENNIPLRTKLNDGAILDDIKDITRNGLRDKSVLDKALNATQTVMNLGDAGFRSSREIQATASIYNTKIYNSYLKLGKTVEEAKKLTKNMSADARISFMEYVPLDDLEKAQIKFAGDYSVKTQNSQFKSFMNDILNKINDKPGLHVIKNSIVPFTSWSSNAIDSSIDHIPGLALLKKNEILGEKNIDLLKKVAKGSDMSSIEKRAFSTMIGRQMSGASLLGLGAILYSTGRLNFYDDMDATERDINASLNRPNFSINIGEKDYVPIDFAEPGSWMLTLGATLVKAQQKYSNNKQALDEIGADDEVDAAWLMYGKTIIGGISTMLLDNSTFSQFQTVSDVLNSENEITWAKFYSNAIRSHIPFAGAATDVNKVIDPTRRQTTDKTNGVISNVANDLTASIIPGYSTTLNPQYDISGAAKERSVVGAITGINALAEHDDPQAKEWLRLYNETGKSTVVPNARLWVISSSKKAPDYMYTADQQKTIQNLKLNADEYTKFAYIYGNVTKAYSQKIMESSQYSEMTDLQKAALMEKTINRAGVISLNYYRRDVYGNEATDIVSTK